MVTQTVYPMQASASLIIVPTNPSIPGAYMISRRGPAQQRQPLSPIFNHITQSLTHQIGILQVVMLADQLVLAGLFLGSHLPHGDFAQYRRFGGIG